MPVLHLLFKLVGDEFEVVHLLVTGVALHVVDFGLIYELNDLILAVSQETSGLAIAAID